MLYPKALIAENYIPKWSILEFKLQTYDRISSDDETFLSIYNCQTFSSWIKLSDSRIRICLNKDNSKNNNNAECHGSRILKTNT